MIRESTEANTFEPYTPTNRDLYNAIEDSDSPFATVKSVNHRGYSIVAPENTLPAYKLSKAYGYAYAETDVSYTSDGVAVCLHDDTINRTARNSDGTQISATKYINQITYAEASSYDYGIYKGENYKGTKIPTIEEFVSLCRRLDLRPYIELKSSGNYTQQSVSAVVDIVKKYGMLDKTTWISFESTYLEYVKTADSKARLGYLLSTISSTGINEALALKTNDNEVFIDCNISNVTDALINDVITAGLPLEAWTIDRSTQLIAMNPYISGVTSNCLIASKLLRAAEA
jgi:glycerophosphoryl diester phosphodiesterase